MMKLKITFIIPLVLIFLSLSYSLFFYWRTNENAAEIIRTQDLSRVKLDITRLQNILYNILTEDFSDIESARLNLSVTAMDNNIKKLLLASEHDEVIIANRYNWEGVQAEVVSGYEKSRAASLKESNAPILYFSDQQETLLKGYFPVVLKLENIKGLAIKKRGVLYVEYSLANELRQAHSIAVKQSLNIAGVLFGGAFFIALLLHVIISRRLSVLTLVTEKVSTGNLDVKAGLGGNDELSGLGRAFDEMVVRLKGDINRRRIAEKELKHVNENLEHIVEQRSAELESKKEELLEAQARAHHANKMSALGEMAGGMAHEINSPLQAITLLTFKLKRDTLSGSIDQRKEIAEMIDSTVYRISNIIESLRKMSRGSSSDPYDKISLKDIVDNVIGITKERYFIKGIQFDTEYHDGCEFEEVYCQQTLLGQVIINLLNNAYDAVKNLEEKWIKLDLYANENNVQFIVTDSGFGIKKEQRDKIFEPMFTTKKIGEGTGLGLSISMEIARNHGGSLELDVETEHTCFILTIPKKQKK